MPQVFLFNLTLFLSVLLSHVSLSCMIPFREIDQSAALALFSGIEQRKKRVEEIEKKRAAFKKKADEEKVSLTKKLGKVKIEITKVQELVKSKVDEKSREVDFLNKRLMLLSNRKHAIDKMRELLLRGMDLYEKHIKLDREIVDFVQVKKEDLKPVYSWREFREAQIRASEVVAKIDSAKSKRSDVMKQRDAEREKIATLLKQLEVKNKERDKITAGVKPGGSTFTLKQDAEIMQDEMAALDEQIQLARLMIDVLDVESGFQGDEVEFLNLRLDEQRQALCFVEKRLVLDQGDVDLANTEWKSEAQKVLQQKEDLELVAEPKREEKITIAAEIEKIRSEVSELKSAGKKGDPETKVLTHQLRKLESGFTVLEKELALIEEKKALAEMSVTIKELQYHMVELQQRLRRPVEKQDLTQFFTNFKTQREFVLSVLRGLKERSDAIGKSLIESNRAIESLKVREIKIKDRENTVFKERHALFGQILKNVQETRSNLHQQIFLTQQYLGINSDLINNQEKIINLYNLILDDLEHRLKTMSIWKRSAKAITFGEFVSALSEAEALFKRMFWEVPSSFSPVVIVHALKDWVLLDPYLVILFVLLFGIFFVGFRLLLKRVRRRKVAMLAQSHPTQRSFLYYNIILAFIDFALENFVLLFTWLFLYLHVLFQFGYVFVALQRFNAPIYIASFFFLSIPILVYLSHELLGALKDLNKKLSYLFFTEKIQDRLIVLLSAFFYSTAILIPIRSALIAYAQQTSLQSATVILAAYSLILVLVFAFFVDKEYVLTLIPEKYFFLVHLKRLIDQHYYPVSFFFMVLLVLSNPYIGYSNLAWYLAFVVPSTVLAVSAIFSLHHYIRKYSVFLFMKEDEDEFADKFEYAKTYYGFFVIFSFIALLIGTFLLVARLWGYHYSPADIWKLLAEEWIIRIDGTTPLGFVQFSTLALFIAGGFFLSSIICRFVLNKLFDVLRTEPGTQNTFTRIFHYAIVGFSIMLGFTAIKLTQVIFWAGSFFFFGIGWALKDLVIDFFAGFLVLIERPIEIGNYISIDSIEGTVRRIAARSTTITTGRNLSVIIPNKDLVNKQIINWGHGRFAVGIEIYIRVDHKSDPEEVKKIIASVLQSNPLILRVPNIIVRLEGLEENAYYFLARGFISARRVKDQFDIASMLRIEMIKAFREHDIVFAQPQRIIHFDQEGPKAQAPLEIKFDQ